MGDSFVAGHGDRTGLGWTGRIAVEGLARGLDLTAYDLGVRRDTSLDVLARLAQETRPRLAAAADPRIVLSFGVNDTVVEERGVRVPLSSTVDALRRMQRAVEPVPVLLVGPPAVDDDQQNRRIAETDAALGAEAARLGMPHLSCFAATRDDDTWRREVRAGDRFHPGAAGYEVLAAVLGQRVLDWLERPQAAPSPAAETTT